jgi:hypothetical protein
MPRRTYRLESSCPNQRGDPSSDRARASRAEPSSEQSVRPSIMEIATQNRHAPLQWRAVAGPVPTLSFVAAAADIPTTCPPRGDP